MIPLLYSICGKAQASACVSALETAQRVSPAPMAHQLRARVVAVETLREHLWRMLLDWPQLTDAPVDRTTLSRLLALSKSLFAAADPSGRLLTPDTRAADFDRSAWCEALDALEQLASEHVFAMPSEAWLDGISDEPGLREWAARTRTAPARLLGATFEEAETGIGQSAVAELPPLDTHRLADALLGETAAAFVACPTWNGSPHETGPLTRQAGTALAAALRERDGNGLLPRLAARLTEVAALLSALRAGSVDAGPTAAPCPGVGIGCVEAARGRLIHLARVEAGRIQDYRILAPTEWNFHPRGALAQGLEALATLDAARIQRRARRLVTAIDPCVDYALTLSTDDHNACVSPRSTR